MVMNMEMNFNAKKAKELTKTVKEINKILKNVREDNFLWNPIIRSIEDGRNTVVINIYGEREENFVNELKELGYKVTTGSQYNEPYYSISWQ